MRKDFDANEWSTSHDDDFKRLIANARKKRETQLKSTTPGAPVSSAGPMEPQAQQPAGLPVDGSGIGFSPDVDASDVIDLSR